MRLTRATTITIAAALAATALGALPMTPAQAAARPKLRHVTETGAYGKGEVKSVAARCPAGFRVISGGGANEGAKRSTVLTEARPFHTRTGDGYTVTFRRSDYSTEGRWRAVATAVCAKGLKRVHIAHRTRPPNSTGHGRAVAACRPGTKVLGFGGRVTGASWQLVLTGLGAARQGRAGYAVTDHAGEDSVPPWRLTAYAVCAKPPAGWRLLTRTTSATRSAKKSHHLGCQGKGRPYGGGADVFYRRGHTDVALSRFGTGQARKRGAYADAHRLSAALDRAPWRLRITTVCAR